MKKEKILLFKFAAMMFVCYIGYAFTYTLLIPFLTTLGYGAVERGFLFSFGAVLTIIGQFFFGYLCDKFKTDKKVFILTSVLFAVVTWMLYASTANATALVVLWASMVFALFRIVMSILDCWAIESDKYCLDNYGWIRAFGAIGWAVGAPVSAFLLTAGGYISLGNAFIVITVVTIIASYFIPDATKFEADKKVEFTDVKKLLLNPNFVILTAVFFFINFINNADLFTTIDKMMALGADEAMISLKWSFQAICELPLFFLGGWLIKKFGGVKVMIFASSMYIFRYILYAMAVTPIQIVWVSGFQMFTFPLIMICSKLLIDEVSPLNLRASGQQISASVYIGFSSLISPIIVGSIVQAFSYNTALYVVAGVSLVPLFLMVYYSSRRKVSQ